MAKNASYYDVNLGKKLKNVTNKNALPVNFNANPISAVQNINNKSQASYMQVPEVLASYKDMSGNTNSSNNNYDNASYYDSYGYGGGGAGVSGPQKIDLTDILASYEQGAAAQTKAIEDSRESQRQSLLTSLKRFQDETAEARNQQRRAYNASRADLEGQAFMANRQAAQNAAARGLGGSGLQQLAQLQNLINQSAATDKLAQSNTDVLKQLAAAAQNKEEDTNTAIQNLSKEAANKLATIAANNAQAKAELQYKEDVRYEQARQAAEQLAAQLAASNAAASSSYAQQKADLENITKADLDDIRSAGLRALYNVYEANQDPGLATTDTTKAALAQTLNDYQTALLNSAQGTGVNSSEYATQLDSLYNKLVSRDKRRTN